MIKNNQLPDIKIRISQLSWYVRHATSFIKSHFKFLVQSHFQSKAYENLYLDFEKNNELFLDKMLVLMNADLCQYKSFS